MCAFGIWTTLCRFSADIKDQQQQQRKQNKKYTQSEMHLHWNEFHCNGFPPEFFHFCFYAILCSKSGSVSVSVKWKRELFTEWLSFFLQCFNDVKTLKESLFSVKVHNTAAMHLSHLNSAEFITAHFSFSAEHQQWIMRGKRLHYKTHSFCIFIF